MRLLARARVLFEFVCSLVRSFGYLLGGLFAWLCLFVCLCGRCLLLCLFAQARKLKATPGSARGSGARLARAAQSTQRGCVVRLGCLEHCAKFTRVVSLSLSLYLSLFSPCTPVSPGAVSASLSLRGLSLCICVCFCLRPSLSGWVFLTVCAPATLSVFDF